MIKSSGFTRKLNRQAGIFLLLCFPLNLFTLFSCAKPEINDDSVVAKVGKKTVTVRDFRISYELAPPGAKSSSADVLTKKKHHLRKMVENKLLTIAGTERGLDKDEDIQRLVKWYEKEEVIRELYREVVGDQVKVSEEEARQAYVLLSERLYLRQLLFRSKSEANVNYQRLKNGETFEQIAMEIANSEKELRYILTPREFKWGELEENFERAVYGLNHMETSAPIKSGAAYHLVQLVNRKKNLFLTESGFEARRHFIETIIRRRKEAQLAKAYLKSMMVDRRLKLNGPVLLNLTQQAGAILNQEGRERPVPPAAQSRVVRRYLKDLMDKDLVLFEGRAWTVGKVFDRFEQMHPDSRPDLTNPGRLQVDLALMLRDEILAQEGYRRRLEENDTVQKEVNRIREKVVAEKMRQTLLDTVKVSDEEIQSFFEENILRYQLPEMVNIREIMVRDRQLADSLHRIIQGGGDIGELAGKYSLRKWAAQKGGELGYFPKEAFGSLSKIAFAMQIGQLSEPVPVKIDTFTVGYSVFKLIGRKPEVTPKLQDVYNQVAEDALAAKKQQVLITFLEGLKKHHPPDIHEEVLASIPTSDELGTGRPIDILKITRR